MATRTSARLVGHLRLIRRLKYISSAFSGPPLQKKMKEVAKIVQQSAVGYAPVDTGRLKRSIRDKVIRSGPKVIGSVATDVEYAPFMEYPTSPHWPPPGALEGWATRHGWNEYDIRFYISVYGTSAHAMRIVGRRGFYYMDRAVRKNEDEIIKRIGAFVVRTINTDVR